MPIPANGPTISRALARDEVYATLQAWIVEGVLKPGETVRDLDLAESLGVSRTPVREALHRLTQEGLIHMAPNRWTRVAPIDKGEIRAIYPIIASLEALAMELVGEHLTDSQIKAMSSANERLRQALKAPGVDDPSVADLAFHALFIDATHNAELTRILAELKLKLRRVENLYFGTSVVALSSISEHEQIIALLTQKDFSAAVQAVRHNWYQSMQRVIESIPSTS